MPKANREDKVKAVKAKVIGSEMRSCHGDFSVEQDSKRSDDDSLIKVSFSSETPVLRWFGWEIIDHSPGAIDLRRLNSAGAVLWNHDTAKIVGITKDAAIESKRGVAYVQFSKNAFPQEIFRDVKDGIIKHVSCRYTYQDLELVEDGTKREDGLDVWKVTKIEVLEISFVSIPADPTVGVGRGVG